MVTRGITHLAPVVVYFHCHSPHWTGCQSRYGNSKFCMIIRSRNVSIVRFGAFLVTKLFLDFVFVHWIQWFKWRSYRKNSNSFTNHDDILLNMPEIFQIVSGTEEDFSLEISSSTHFRNYVHKVYHCQNVNALWKYSVKNQIKNRNSLGHKKQIIPQSAWGTFNLFFDAFTKTKDNPSEDTNKSGEIIN